MSISRKDWRHQMVRYSIRLASLFKLTENFAKFLCALKNIKNIYPSPVHCGFTVFSFFLFHQASHGQDKQCVLPVYATNPVGACILPWVKRRVYTRESRNTGWPLLWTGTVRWRLSVHRATEKTPQLPGERTLPFGGSGQHPPAEGAFVQSNGLCRGSSNTSGSPTFLLHRQTKRQ